MSCDDQIAVSTATQAEAEAGMVNNKAMTPLRVKQAIDTLGVSKIELASPLGSGIVGSKRDAPSAVPATVKARLDQVVSVKDWGVEGSSTVADIAKIQAAVDEAPLGSTLLLPGGIIFSTGLSITRQINIRAENGATILGVGADPNAHLIDMRIAPGGTLEGSSNAMLFTNFRAEVALGYAANSTLNIESQNGVGAAQLNYSFIGGRIAGRDDQGGAALRIAGLHTQLHTFQNVDIWNGVHLEGCADACRFIACPVGGLRTGFVIDVVPGAFHTLIRDCVITARNAAVHVKGGSRVKIFDNQIEQHGGINGHPDDAHIILEALSYSLRDIEIIGNNFGGGGDVTDLIVMKTSGGRTIDGTKVYRNTYARSLGYDVRITDPGVRHTYFDSTSNLRGDRGGGGYTIYPTYSSNSLNVNDLLLVSDAGIATRYIHKGAVEMGGTSATALINSWTCPATMYAQIIGDEVRFSGYADGPPAPQIDLVFGQMPEGMRPQVDVSFLLPGYDLLTGASVPTAISVTPTGYLTANRAGSTNAVRVNLAGIRFTAARTGYDPGY